MEDREEEYISLVAKTRQAEQYVLGVLLSFRDKLPPESLKATDFRDGQHRRIYAAIQKAHAQGLEPDILAVSRLVDGGISARKYITDLSLSVATAANLDYYAEQVKAYAIDREKRELARILFEDSDRFDETLARLNRLSEPAPKAKAREVSLTKRLIAGLKKRWARLFTGVQSHYSDIDSALEGGFENGLLYAIGARPAMGKTAIGINIAHNVAMAGRKVAFISAEMLKERVQNRLLLRQCWGQVTSQQLKTGDIPYGAHQWEVLARAAADLAAAPIKVYDTSDGITTIAGIKKILLADKPDFVVIDHFSKLTGEFKVDRQTMMRQVSADLLEMTKELGIPVVILCQLVRDVDNRKDKKPKLSDLSETGGLDQDCDVAMFLYRESYYRQLGEEEKDLTELIVAKNRDGQAGTINLAFEGSTQRFFTVNQWGGRKEDKANYWRKSMVQFEKWFDEEAKEWVYERTDGGEYTRPDGSKYAELVVWNEEFCKAKCEEWAKLPDSQQLQKWRGMGDWLLNQPDEMHTKWASDCLHALTMASSIVEANLTAAYDECTMDEQRNGGANERRQNNNRGRGQGSQGGNGVGKEAEHNASTVCQRRLFE